ncbi:MAG TPA: PDZ domain-containing protein [Kofleriaceae bacterium]|jgi:predicted metalloprotease with PDZ domain|nr:PDZ domain-containing protein [Kofleriaceae bacterium]
MSRLSYTVRVLDPARHLVEIELRFPVDTPTVELVIPAWCPGSYLIRDYARFVRDLVVDGDDGAPRPAIKRDKSTWSIETRGARALHVRYAVYGHELTVRTNHIDPGHAFLHGPATFLYPTHLRKAPVELFVTMPDSWAPITSMAWNPEYRMLTAANVDELYDHPIHLAPERAVRTYDVPVTAPRLTVRLAIWGERAPGGVFDEARLVTDLGAVVDDHIARFGAAPFPRYTFLVMLSHDAYGGLEHHMASVNLYHPHFAASRKHYEGLLELLSHELFHAWNGKRIAPASLLWDFDYAREAYTPFLWLMEGLTSHYDRFALRTSNRISAKSLLEKTLDDWARLQATPGRRRQSLEASSFDAWIKLYKPDESNLNTTVSYYLKGGLVMFALDLQIRRRTAGLIDGQRSLDDVLRLLWKRYGATGEPHPTALQPVFEEAAGIPLGDVFDRQIRGTEDPELAEELRHVGLELRTSADPAQIADGASPVWIGATLGGTKVTGVLDDSPACAAGLAPGDEIIAIDGFRVTSDGELRSIAGAQRPGDAVELAVFRRGRLRLVPVTLGAAPPTRYEIAGIADAGPAAARYQAWLGEPHPGAQVLATITTTARWV